jgi:hypothetical protein
MHCDNLHCTIFSQHGGHLEIGLDPIYKSKHGVYLTVVTNRAGQGNQGRHPRTAGHFQLRLKKQQWWCLSMWAVLGKFLMELP